MFTDHYFGTSSGVVDKGGIKSGQRESDLSFTKECQPNYLCITFKYSCLMQYTSSMQHCDRYFFLQVVRKFLAENNLLGY